ncbi:MAG: right-handed parallel beta-helix repeat-containing protein [Marinifilaceae bacterium]
MKRLIILTALLIVAINSWAKHWVYDMKDFGALPGSSVNVSPIMGKLLAQIEREVKKGDKVTIRFAKGRYDFHPQGAEQRTYYISNHDQDNPKLVGLPLERINNLTIEGNGADFVFHGRMIPLSLMHASKTTLKDFTIDFENPQIAQVKIVESNPETGMTFEVAPWVNYEISKEGYFETSGDGWRGRQGGGIVFEGDTKRIVYNTSDIGINTKDAKQLEGRKVLAPNWKDSRIKPGMAVAMRMWYRPTPGIFMSHNTDTRIENVKVHYAEGMGLLAQLCTNITMDGFCVSLKGDNDPRYFTTQADATHFSGCRGKISSCNGLYEGMMDDAINVHGTYLKIIKRIDDKNVIGRYMHGQAWGFEWGRAGDAVQFVKAETMELVGGTNKVSAIKPYDKEQIDGAREFHITFEKPLAAEIGTEGIGIENLEWTPEVYFAGNTIRNNRARGALFSTPKRTVVENNIFDHTSGTAILLCGDCNGWYETGACLDVVIRKNTFINALTCMFQFTNAVISIYPEIPNLKGQTKYFHGGKGKGIVITDNRFETFDRAIVYAKSIDGLIFKNNVIKNTTDYKPFHWNKHRFLFERATNVKIENNDFEDGFDETKDVKYTL